MKRLLSCLLLCGTAHAETPERPPVGSAVLRTHGVTMGVFDPLRIALRPDLELSTHPLLFLALDPNAALRVGFVRTRRLAVTGEYGLSVPTALLRLTKGTLFPSWDKSNANVGWVVVPTAALAVTTLVPRGIVPDAFTVRIGTAVGIELGRNDATDLDTLAPLELALAPVTNGHRTHAEAQYDVAFWESLHLRLGVDAYYLGAAPAPAKSPLVLDARATLDLYPARAWRLSLGVVGYDYDQRGTEVRIASDGRAVREHVRSRELWPTFDLVYAP